ncbi:hypothetical protein L1999_12575 [Neobacillus drentensis]|uniref:hypothetical protein n=1 Tax=Neobacillus drentensis TaxID=220684 RepID=UPI001F1FB640|nr:hypothetical protein [Neobacillus drentensis]ULT59305.1 hypothetical protein L1999_12575 [Neobacillus drentensis]
MKRFSPSFFIGSISIGTVEGASCVNLGNNLPSGFVNYKKQNQGFGSISGDNNDIHDILATIEEEAITDTFHYDVLAQSENEQFVDKIKKEMFEAELNIGEEPDEENSDHNYDQDV